MAGGDFHRRFVGFHRQQALFSAHRVAGLDQQFDDCNVCEVANVGDRPIQVGSHYHFFEVNPGLVFEREQARGKRLDIAPGTAVRFEPGSTREVALVPLSGGRTVYGFRGDVMGKL